MTPFSSGRPRYQIPHIPDGPMPTATATATAPTPAAITGVAAAPTGPTSVPPIANSAAGVNKFFDKCGTHVLRVTDVGGTIQNSVALYTMRGYYYTIKAGVRHVLLNINPCTSAFFNNIRWERECVSRGLRVRIQLGRGNKQSDLATFTCLNTCQARVKTIQGLECAHPSTEQVHFTRTKTLLNPKDTSAVENYIRTLVDDRQRRGHGR
ncbi:hypothetical protein BU25DRAFT_482255 [Macroventuria anomochaeta]|uniref:Uncharacterized protein n=1 Tax=Macroventuria anomochaeta TaxID=301207 RepID=A0ACB6RJ58_9PLEO|nr:uncharacterized protein BU25DRAFT_482255 [Macroventuria anomochaeta]KAF2621778.1 hypothetical protein BU25DRAFT_482255 [Macroventuria anomochaeta]